MQLIRPSRLQPGDLIGVVAPSSPVAHFVPRRLARGLAELERLGFRVRLGRHATGKHGHTAGTISDRTADLHEMFADPEVKGIITTIGGSSSNQLLDELDYDLIAANPKVLMGYSDITALHLGIHVRTGLVTFLGPAVLPQFGEAGGLMPYIRQAIQRTVCTASPVGELEPSPEIVAEALRWDVEDDRPRRTTVNPGPQALRSGAARGRIIAGNLSTMLLLAGTPYWPDLKGAILCVEGAETETPASVDRHFTQLRHMGVYDVIAGLVVGRFAPSVGFTPEDSFEEILLTATRGYSFPIGIGFDFGHWDPIFVLPNGVQGELVVEDGAARFAILESAVV